LNKSYYGDANLVKTILLPSNEKIGKNKFWPNFFNSTTKGKIHKPSFAYVDGNRSVMQAREKFQGQQY